jgi:hypothetical protein
MGLFGKIIRHGRKASEPTVVVDAELKLQAHRHTPGGAAEEVEEEYTRLVLQKYGRAPVTN